MSCSSHQRRRTTGFFCLASLIGVNAGACDEPTTDGEIQASQVAFAVYEQRLLHASENASVFLDICTKLANHGWDATHDAELLAQARSALHEAGISLEAALSLRSLNYDSELNAIFDEAFGFASPGVALESDGDLFNDQGFRGYFALERIVFADRVRSPIAARESELYPGLDARFPATSQEAWHLCEDSAKPWVAQVHALRDRWQSHKYDVWPLTSLVFSSQVSETLESELALVLYGVSSGSRSATRIVIRRLNHRVVEKERALGRIGDVGDVADGVEGVREVLNLRFI